MSTKIGANQRCPCGSGRKYKKCCDGAGVEVRGLPHTHAERESALAKLESFIDEQLGDEEDAAFEDFWGRFFEREGELPPDLLENSNAVEETWFAFDCEIADGVRPVDQLLARVELTPGERSFLEAMRRSTMHLYEVIEVVPGSSITLRDLVEGSVVTVAERMASRTVSRHECLAARVIPRGCSGRPEIERGLLPIPLPLRDRLVEHVKAQRAEFLRDEPGKTIVACDKELPPVFHDAWVGSIFEPAVPALANTDGETMVLTRVSFHVADPDALGRALDAAKGEGLIRTGEGAWIWVGKNSKGDDTTLANLQLGSELLTLEANSVERGVRARDLVERLLGTSVRHRGTIHEDMRRKVVEAVTARALGREPDEPRAPSEALDPNAADALVSELYSRHYRA